MVIIFVLLVFVLAQAFLTVTLSGRSHELDKANQQLSELADALSLERGKSAELQLSVSQLARNCRRARPNATGWRRNSPMRTWRSRRPPRPMPGCRSQLTDTTGQADSRARRSWPMRKTSLPR